jgi:hypothetical protein
LWVEEDQDRRRVNVVWRHPEVEALKQDGHSKLGFQPSQVLGYAHPSADPERDERQGVLRCSSSAVGKPRRVELRGVRAPEPGVVVDGHDRDEELHATGDHAPVRELDVRLGVADGGHRGRVQPEGLVDDHAELSKAKTWNAICQRHSVAKFEERTLTAVVRWKR